jgi:hypothetical protein
MSPEQISSHRDRSHGASWRGGEQDCSLGSYLSSYKIIIPTDSIDKAFHHANNELKTNAHRYLETFGQD